MAVTQNTRLWPEGRVPYIIEPSLRSVEDLIQRAMRHIEQNSCIRFARRTNETHFVRITKQFGCYSTNPGRNFAGEQVVSIGRGCEHFGIILHELMHVLGFHHEHRRPDRDSYIKINWNNIQSGLESQFQKLNIEEYQDLAPFDYDSIMLYGNYTFSKMPNKLKTIERRDGRPLPENRNGLSELDIRKLNAIYGCTNNYCSTM